MAAIAALNPKAEYAKSQNAFKINLSAALGLHDVMRTNLGPKGTLKMLVSGAGDIKLTKDGNTCLNEMHIKHPTASLIARVATAQDDITGDGTTSSVLMIAELLKQADRLIFDGGYQLHTLHPRVVTEGFDMARKKALETLSRLTIPLEIKDGIPDRNTLISIASMSVKTKLHFKLAEQLSEHMVDAVLAVREAGKSLDLHRVEIMEMTHKRDMDTTLIKGLVMDHGGRHPDMPKMVTNAYILTLNVSMEYEKTEINSGFFYKSAAERDRLVEKEREFINERVRKVIDLKRKVCGETNGYVNGNSEEPPSFVVINQKGIDPISLDLLARDGILALRRAKRRNMERLTLACGGVALNSVDNLTPECLGKAGKVYEYTLGDEKYTFVEECKFPQSVTILIKGPNKHTILQIKDAVNDGLKSIRNCLEDGCLLPGAGAVEVATYLDLMKYRESLTGREAFGVETYARSLMVIPKVLAENAGLDAAECETKLLAQQRKIIESGLDGRKIVGIDLESGEPAVSYEKGIFDNLNVKKQILESSCVIASNILLVDEMMRAGLDSLKG